MTNAEIEITEISDDDVSSHEDRREFNIVKIEHALAVGYESWRAELTSESSNGLPVVDASYRRLFREFHRALLA